MGWQEEARKLRIGQRRKVPHCSKDASAYIENTTQGVRLHCFRCKASEFEPHGRLSLLDVLNMRRSDQEAQETPSFPGGIPLLDAPIWAQLWVLKAGISPEVAHTEYGFRYNNRMDRVVAPVLNNSVDTGVWFARANKGRSPKYIMPKGTQGALWYDIPETSTVLVVVEDVLSAIRVSRAGYAAVAALGTTPSREIGVLARDRSVIGWFDGDRAGRNGFVALRRVLGPFGIKALRIEAEGDPKDYQTHEIRRLVQEVRS